MLALKNLLMVGVAVAGLAGAAQAHEETIFVPGHYETRTMRVEEPGRWVEQQKWIEGAGRWETQWKTVELPGHYEKVERQVWVEARVVGVRTGASARIGSVRIGLALPCTEVVPGHWETRCEEVWVEGKCEQQAVQVFVPGCKHLETVRVWQPGCERDQVTQVYVPGRYETRCVEDRSERRGDRVSVGIGIGPIGIGFAIGGHRR